ncbi:hypothetical protein DFH09DRAFT_1073208 [Mycena vulgaris]|nr:hypothetical protein DFH09DRAFT_1073208 [Mycena vulgaris]
MDAELRCKRHVAKGSDEKMAIMFRLSKKRLCTDFDMGNRNMYSPPAKAMGVGRSTLYRHMEERGLSTARREWSDLTDDQIGELVSEISLAHPFVTTTIVLGHLEAHKVHLPQARVQESLRRVDRIGVLVRCAPSKLLSCLVSDVDLWMVWYN